MRRPIRFHNRLNRHGRKQTRMAFKALVRKAMTGFIRQPITQDTTLSIKSAMGEVLIKPDHLGFVDHITVIPNVPVDYIQCNCTISTPDL